MRLRLILVLSCLLSTWITTARADDGDQDAPTQQLSTVQSHLKAMEPTPSKPASAVPALARLVGKMLAAQLKDVRVELEPETPSANGPTLNQGALHLNRRAEICLDNYRLGFKRDGMVLRYERAF
jgi:hypothetical protein